MARAGLMMRQTHRAALAVALVCAGVLVQGGKRAHAQQLYAKTELAQEARRLKTAATKIFKLGLEPFLTADERAKLGRVTFAFPLPKPRDTPLNFYATRGVDGNTVTLPILSLKTVEDLTLAYVYAVVQQRELEPIDLYFAAVANQTPSRFRGGRPPDILTALGIPKDAYKLPVIDKSSLSLRNEAFAFIIAHELAHIIFRHKGLGQITKKQARAGEVEADRFAVDLMARSNTPAVGAILYFQAQVYALPHPANYPSKDLWQNYLSTAPTHPLSTDRIRALAAHMRATFARLRANENPFWQFAGRGFSMIAKALDDHDLHKCIAEVAKEIPVDKLKLSPLGAKSLLAERNCR